MRTQGDGSFLCDPIPELSSPIPANAPTRCLSVTSGKAEAFLCEKGQGTHHFRWYAEMLLAHVSDIILSLSAKISSGATRCIGRSRIWVPLSRPCIPSVISGTGCGRR